MEDKIFKMIVDRLRNPPSSIDYEPPVIENPPAPQPMLSEQELQDHTFGDILRRAQMIDQRYYHMGGRDQYQRPEPKLRLRGNGNPLEGDYGFRATMKF